MAIPDSANYAIDALIARHGLQPGAALLGISRQHLENLRRRQTMVPLEVVPFLVIGADDPAVTVATVRPDWPGFHLMARLYARRGAAARFFGDINPLADVRVSRWLMAANPGATTHHRPTWND